MAMAMATAELAGPLHSADEHIANGTHNSKQDYYAKQKYSSLIVHTAPIALINLHMSGTQNSHSLNKPPHKRH